MREKYCTELLHSVSLCQYIHFHWTIGHIKSDHCPPFFILQILYFSFSWPNCVTQLKRYTLDKLSSTIFCCLSVCLWGIGDTRPNLHFFNIYRHKVLGLVISKQHLSHKILEFNQSYKICQIQNHWMIKGGVKKTCFFYFWSKGGGARPIKNPYQKILRFCFTKNWVFLLPFLTFFDQKMFFFTIFFIKGGGGLAQSNKTIGDEGITVDFSIIKVHTSNWSSNSWGSSNSSFWDNRVVGDHRIPLDL